MRKITYLLISSILLIISCTKETQDPEIILPAAYNFENVDFSGQKSRLAMLTAIATEMRKGLSEDLSSTTLINMYSNNANPFSNDTLNSSGKQLRDKTFADDIPVFDSYFQRIAEVSLLRANNVTGPGQAGTAVSVVDNTKKYLVDSNGVEYAQVIQKGLMGAVFYYRIAAEYTTPAKLDGGDNTTVVPGQGTAMQHYWDEAFGYWGVPVSLRADNFDSLSTAKQLFFYGTYVSKGNSLNVLSKLLNAYIKGRDAINRRDYADRDEAGAEVRKQFELINACSYISYLNQGIANFGDYAVRCHVLSEGYGFFLSLKYNPGKLITTTAFDGIYDQYYVGGKLSVSHLTLSQLTDIRDGISTIYGLDAIKTSL